MIQTNSLNADRQSNVELIRIVAMVFIVLWHIVIHATKNSIVGSEYIKSFTGIGVNLFVMISGYFNIHLSSKSFINLIGVVLFYNFLSIVVAISIFNYSVTINDITNIFFPMSKYGRYWFVSCYLMLMLFSPVINSYISKCSKVEYMGFLILLAYISCVSGWWFKNPINVHGFTVFNMVFIYMIGDCIRRFHIASKISPSKWFLLYLLFTAVICLMFFYAKGRAATYNNPIFVASTISLFAFFINLKIQNSIINKISACMFSVYLLQDGFIGKYAYQYMYNKGVDLNFRAEYWLYILFYIVILFAAALVLEPIRKKVMSKPISFVQCSISNKIKYFRNNNK